MAGLFSLIPLHFPVVLVPITYGRWGVLSPQQLQEVIVAAHALLTAGDEKAAQSLLAAFTSSGVDPLC